MMTRLRLETVSHEMVQLFQAAPVARQAKAAQFACTLAVTETGLLDRENVKAAIDMIGRSEAGESDFGIELEKTVAEFDSEYFRLYAEAGREWTPLAREFFSKARAAAAVAFAIKQTTEGFAEAIVEAVNAVNDRDAIIRSTTSMLSPENRRAPN